MNRNAESRFSLNPTNIDLPRSRFDRSAGVKFSGNVGDLIPFLVEEVLPGDTFKVSTSKVVRLSTLIRPIMDNLYMDTYYFFVPNRLVWDHWKNFCGESATAWMPEVEYRIPKLNILVHPGVGSLADYMGIPLNIQTSTLNSQKPERGVNALPFRAYAKICNDWFRSEVLQDELVIDTGDADKTMNAASASDLYCALGGPVFKACKYHDYFTSCLPSPQSGPDVHIPVTPMNPALQGFVPVGVKATTSSMGDLYGNFEQSVGMRFGWNGSENVASGTKNVVVKTNGGTDPTFSGHFDLDSNSALAGTTHTFYPTNLFADVGSWLGTINDLRVAFQVQKFYEKFARGGRRYIEVLKSQFGVTSPDARLQRSEYLGGNRIPLNVSEVTNNTLSDSASLGELGAMSRTNDSHHDFVKSFTEHGYVIGVCVVRYDHSYPQGLERHWFRTSMLDYYWPVFANLGEQAVKNGEICFETGDNTVNPYETFGYQERWAEYRFKQSRCSGYMRPEASGSLASWHLGDYYDQSSGAPFLSDSWIREDPGNVDRVLAASSEVTHQFIADFYIKNICSRAMPMFSIPGLADHH